MGKNRPPQHFVRVKKNKFVTKLFFYSTLIHSSHSFVAVLAQVWLKLFSQASQHHTPICRYIFTVVRAYMRLACVRSVAEKRQFGTLWCYDYYPESLSSFFKHEKSLIEYQKYWHLMAMAFPITFPKNNEAFMPPIKNPHCLLDDHNLWISIYIWDQFSSTLKKIYLITEAAR